jgi:hypothetical protein
MTHPGQSNSRKLNVGVAKWQGEEDRGEQLLETERTDEDEVKIAIGETGLYFSLAAAREVGTQLLERTVEEWGS